MRELVLNAEALIHNFQQIQAQAPTAKALAMVKANAYGHGLVWAAQHLIDAGAHALGVADLHEAEILRAEKISAPIFLVDGFADEDELHQALNLDLTLILHQSFHLQLLETFSISKPLNVWIKIDTGMHRLGFAPQVVPEIFLKLKRLKFIKSIGLMTHFSDADNTANPKTEQQIELFQQIQNEIQSANQLTLQASMANSAGIFAWPHSHADWIRPGIALYGASPFANKTAADLGLLPVMTVSSNIIAINHYEKDTQLGYGSSFTCERQSCIAVVAFGYGDGYPRHALSSEVLVRGHHCKVVGRISMDMIQIDVTDYPDIQFNDKVVLWGEGLPVEGLAHASQTISYEIFCDLQKHRLNVLKPEFDDGCYIRGNLFRVQSTQ